MALRTTTQAGSFTAGTTWIGGVAPVSGDTLAINHAVTWTPGAGSFTIGTGSGTAITFGSAGSLSLAPTGSFALTFAGASAGGNVTGWEFTADATSGAITIYLDATGAGAGFAMVIGGTYDANNQGGWNLTSSSSNRVGVYSLPSDGSKNSWFSSGGTSGGGNLRLNHVDLYRIGNATNQAITYAIDNRNRNVTMNDVTFTNCAGYTIGGSGWTGTASLTDVIHTSSVTDGSNTFPLYLSTQSGTTTFTRCWWDKPNKHNYVTGASWSKCGFNDAWQGSPVATAWTAMDDCFIRIVTTDGGGGVVAAGSLRRSFVFYDSPAKDNPHFWSVSSAIANGTTIDITDNVWYFNGSAWNGNVILLAGANTVTVNVLRNLTLLNSANKMSGALVTSDGSVGAGFRIVIEHNTAFVTSQHGIEIGHLYTTPDSRYQSIKGNLFVGAGYKAYNVDSTTSTDLFSPSVADYNGSDQILTTYAPNNAIWTNQGRGYAAKWSFTPGVHDVDGVNPGFVNPSANLAGWAATIGGSTEADAVAAFKGDLATKIEAVLAYYGAAFRPTATAFHNSAHDGTDMGAYAWISAGTVPYFTSSMAGNFSSLGF